jgi:hypothetical protein
MALRRSLRPYPELAQDVLPRRREVFLTSPALSATLVLDISTHITPE